MKFEEKLFYARKYHFDVLGIKKDDVLDKDDTEVLKLIKTQYKKLVLRCHPDKQADKQADKNSAKFIDLTKSTDELKRYIDFIRLTGEDIYLFDFFKKNNATITFQQYYLFSFLLKDLLKLHYRKIYQEKYAKKKLLQYEGKSYVLTYHLKDLILLKYNLENKKIISNIVFVTLFILSFSPIVLSRYPMLRMSFIIIFIIYSFVNLIPKNLKLKHTFRRSNIIRFIPKGLLLLILGQH